MTDDDADAEVMMVVVMVTTRREKAGGGVVVVVSPTSATVLLDIQADGERADSRTCSPITQPSGATKRFKTSFQ